MIGRQGYTNTIVTYRQTNTDPDAPVALNVVSGAYQTSVIVSTTGASTPSSIATAMAAAMNGDATLTTVLTATASAGLYQRSEEWRPSASVVTAGT